MRAQVQVASNGTLVVRAERSQDVQAFELGDWVEVAAADEPSGSVFVPPEPEPEPDVEEDEGEYEEDED